MDADPEDSADDDATAETPPLRRKSGDPRFDRVGALRSIGALATQVVAPLARKHGAARARLLSEWPQIVGPELARRCRPEKLVSLGRAASAAAPSPGAAPSAQLAAAQAADKARGPSALRLRVGGASALEIQHLAPQIVERINAYFGYRAVERLQLVQGPLPAEPPPPRRPPPLDAAQRRRLEAKLAEVEDDDLRTALGGLGKAVLVDRRR